MEDYSKVLADNILKYRKEGGFTQEALAEKMGVSFQTVSKWETGSSCPEVVRLPELADIFGITLDELFGREAEESSKENAIEVSTVAVQSELPWPNDDTIRAAVFKGHKLLEDYEDMSQFTFCFDGDAMNVVSYCNIYCESIEGSASASGDVNAGGDINVEGDLAVGSEAAAGGDVNVTGNINGAANAGGDINVDGDISGEVQSGGDVNCQCEERKKWWKR